jgi:C_GCAxxG_C_C family probable redox protein
MTDYEALKKAVQKLAERKWDSPAIADRLETLLDEGIPKKTMNRDEILTNKQEILDRVQRHAEENTFLAHSCSKGTALAVMEEFGLGDMGVIQALSPFPGFGGTGWMCGGVTGGLIALGLYFGSDDIFDYESNGATIRAARKFMPRFEKEVGSVICPKIQEDIIFGRYMDPLSSEEKMQDFMKEKGIEKCALVTGIGARIAAEIIIEGLE